MTETNGQYVTSVANNQHIVVVKESRREAYRQLVTHLLGAAAAIYLLVTGEKAPKGRWVV